MLSHMIHFGICWETIVNKMLKSYFFNIEKKS